MHLVSASRLLWKNGSFLLGGKGKGKRKREREKGKREKGKGIGSPTFHSMIISTLEKMCVGAKNQRRGSASQFLPYSTFCFRKYGSKNQKGEFAPYLFLFQSWLF